MRERNAIHTLLFAKITKPILDLRFKHTFFIAALSINMILKIVIWKRRIVLAVKIFMKYHKLINQNLVS